MAITGFLQKLKIIFDDPVRYVLCVGEEEVPLNTLLGRAIELKHTGRIRCIQCHRFISKSFQQGYCYPCFSALHECNLCMLHPERCQIERGGCSGADWVHGSCGQEHFVYLANTSSLKVGVTRATQLKTRWMDQGAQQAIELFKTPNRYQAGLLEVILKKFVSDRTLWRQMLKQDAQCLNLLEERDKLLNRAAKELLSFRTLSVNEDTHTTIRYPMLRYPTQIASLGFEKTPVVSGKLLGLKGQYCIFKNGVINIRKYSGYEISFSDIG